MVLRFGASLPAPNQFPRSALQGEAPPSWWTSTGHHTYYWNK